RDFDRGLKALLQESLESRKLELRAKPTLNMVIPMNVFERSKDLRATELENGGENASVSINDGDGGKVCIKVLVKKGHKQQIKEMFIPGDCSLVQSTKQQEAAELEEKQSIKN
ncbi:Os04g0523200, partial [Oryza sativa Japonica Group]